MTWATCNRCALLIPATTVFNLPQSFYFDYNVASQAVPVPVTTQCDIIHLTWSRGAGTGPDPTAPYLLQVYTSAFVFPFIVDAGSGLSFDWAVPFGPGTLYQICMFDKYGMSGGCQGIYTMISTQRRRHAVVNNGPLSQYGWCSDIQLTPKNGTPPYILRRALNAVDVAPALHPPFNMTGKDQSAMNWTVNLSWGSPFFISVVGFRTVSPATAVASGIGGLLLGLIAGIAAALVYVRRQKRRRGEPLLTPSGSYGLNADPYSYTPASATSAHYKAVPSSHLQDPSSTSIAMQRMQRESTDYQIEPFSMPGEERLRHSSYGSEYDEQQQQVPSSTPGNIYVVHHDAGRAPVTVYHQEGTEVVELPPRYAHDSSAPNSEGPREHPNSPGGGSGRRTSSFSAQEVISPQRRPNRPRKP
ncbi:hypothetical protein B0H17DRAFT_1159447 [Mycena rosella]|uniref:Uncharacterized protein n=1 Tax=Mycena rosella TaxID=1033263 RepID=A0AAD7DNE6_MYCRO|nr:hypothetical protein B0H17DRAFT_1159447 [Mycena rosella]